MADERTGEAARATAIVGIGTNGAAVAVVGRTEEGLQVGGMFLTRGEIDAAARHGTARGLAAPEAMRQCVAGAVGGALRAMLGGGTAGSSDG